MSRHNEYNILAFCAFRYALGRMTYIVGDVCDILRKNIVNIDPYHQALMVKEITEAIDKGHAGMECDVLEWKHLLMVLEQEKNNED